MESFSSAKKPVKTMLSDISSSVIEADLKTATSFDGPFAQNEGHMQKQTLAQHLRSLMNQKGLEQADVVRDSGQDKGYISQLFNGRKTNPSRDKLIAIAFGLHLDVDQTQRMLKLAGFTLYVRDKRDYIILLSIQCGMSIQETDVKLYEQGFPTLLPRN